MDVENAGIDLLTSQEVIPLENTLSEFNKSPSPSASKSGSLASPSKPAIWPIEGVKAEGKGLRVYVNHR